MAADDAPLAPQRCDSCGIPKHSGRGPPTVIRLWRVRESKGLTASIMTSGYTSVCRPAILIISQNTLAPVAHLTI